MQRGEGRGVGNGLDRGRVNVVDDGRRPISGVPYPNTSKNNKSTTATTARTRSGYGNGNHKIDMVLLIMTGVQHGHGQKFMVILLMAHLAIPIAGLRSAAVLLSRIPVVVDVVLHVRVVEGLSWMVFCNCHCRWSCCCCSLYY